MKSHQLALWFLVWQVIMTASTLWPLLMIELDSCVSANLATMINMAIHCCVFIFVVAVAAIEWRRRSTSQQSFQTISPSPLHDVSLKLEPPSATTADVEDDFELK